MATKVQTEAIDSGLAVARANILIVDDRPENAMIIESVLGELEQNLVSVNSGSDALREVLKREFAVILLDVNMPDIDGFETAALIRRYKKSAHTPIIFITAYADDVQVSRGYSLGAVDYIFSPVVPDVLRSKVKVFVELFQMHVRIRQAAEERVKLARAEAARRSAEEKTRRSGFLSHASEVLGQSLDAALIVHGLLDLLVPELVPFAAVLTDDPDGQERLLLRRSGDRGGARTSAVAGEFADVFTQVIGDALLEQSPMDRSVELSKADLWLCTGPTGDAALAQATGFVLPLGFGERHFGSLLLAAAPRSVDDADDRTLFEEVAGRAAMALENADLYNNLQLEIAERRQAEQRLREADQRKDEFLAMLAHELRNPLAPIRTSLEVIKRLAPKEKKIESARAIVERQIVHMTHLVDELLDVGRIGQGKVELQLEPVELTAIIRHAVESTEPLMKAGRHRLKLDIPDEPVWLLGDFPRLSQVMANLLGNAAKFTPRGGKIEVELSFADDWATIVIRDNGIGMEADLLPRIFELFVQGDHSLDRSQGGLGIGLTLAKRLVELHQGEIRALSAGTGHGSEFQITLPCGDASGPLASAPIATRPGLPSKRVLVVDDNDDAAESLADFLKLEGHSVRTACEGHAALAEVTRFKPEVVLLDIGLPGINGNDIARALRSTAESQGIFLIALTGYGRDEDRERSLKSGFDCHLVKPIDPDQLATIVACARR